MPALPVRVGEGLQARNFSAGGYGNTVAYGGTRSSPVQRATPVQRTASTPTKSATTSQYPSGVAGDPALANTISYYQGAAEKGVQAYGDLVGQDFQKQIGTMLGNLNAIGGLRSGGVQAGIDQAMVNYGRQVGDYATKATQDALTIGTEENNAVQERAFREKELKMQQQSGFFGDIGKLLGGVGAAAIGKWG